jgi:hypothetical protein
VAVAKSKSNKKEKGKSDDSISPKNSLHEAPHFDSGKLCRHKLGYLDHYHSGYLPAKANSTDEKLLLVKAVEDDCWR